MVGGVFFLVWLSELITRYGIGNGLALIGDLFQATNTVPRTAVFMHVNDTFGVAMQKGFTGVMSKFTMPYKVVDTIAYDPAAAPLIDTARSDALRAGGAVPELAWTDVGPAAALPTPGPVQVVDSRPDLPAVSAPVRGRARSRPGGGLPAEGRVIAFFGALAGALLVALAPTLGCGAVPRRAVASAVAGLGAGPGVDRGGQGHRQREAVALVELAQGARPGALPPAGSGLRAESAPAAPTNQPTENKMFGRLMPTEGKFFDLFNQHAELCVKGAKEMLALMTNFDDLENRVHAIESIEKQADKITYTTVDLLHKTFITPIDRDDIHKLITKMDDILDMMEDAAQTVSLYDLHAVTPEAKRLAELVLACCEKVKDAVALLSNMDNARDIVAICEEIDRLESDADHVMRAAMSKLFRDEPDVRNLIKMKAIYEILETVTDRCEDVANIIEGIIVENA